MKALTAYVMSGRAVRRPLLSVLMDELCRSDKDVKNNIAHLNEAIATGDANAIAKAQNDVGLSFDECHYLDSALIQEQEYCKSLGAEQFKADSFFGDKLLKAVYSELKQRGKLLDVLTIEDNNVTGSSFKWVLGECKFAIRLFTSKIFSGQRSFYGSVEKKFESITQVLDRDEEYYEDVRLVFVLRDHYEQCRRQFESLQVVDQSYPIDKTRYIICAIDRCDYMHRIRVEDSSLGL